jgi:cyclopropane-fatty-acyl-phospholipid synthase
MTLEQAQARKVDSILAKCRLQEGTRLLDIGCGWGAALRRAVEVHSVRGVGLTIDREQYEVGSRLITENGCDGRIDLRLQKWRDFRERVDRITCINAFEDFSEKEAFSNTAVGS